MAPAELGKGLRRIAEEQIDFGRPAIGRIERNQHVAGAPAVALLLVARPLPLDGPADLAERQLDELTYRMGLAGRQHVVVGLLLLEDAPHALDIVAGVTPVALGVEVAEIKAVLIAALDGRDGARDLAGHEGFAADRRFVIEQDPVRRVHAIGLAVVHRDPVGVELCHGIGTARIERRQLALRRLTHLAEQFGRRGLVEAHPILHLQNANRLEHAQRSEGVGVGRVFRRLEAHLHVALCRQVVDLGRLDLVQQP